MEPFGAKLEKKAVFSPCCEKQPHSMTEPEKKGRKYPAFWGSWDSKGLIFLS